MDRSQRREFTREMNKSTGSYELVLSPLVLALLGFAVDSWLGTRPILTIMAAVLGLVGAVIKIYYRYAHDMAKHDDEGVWSRRDA